MSAPKHPPPWLFALTGMPYGVVGAFASIVMPFVTRNVGEDVGDIGWFVALLFVPTMLQFLYTPIIDFGPKRKHWLLIVTFVGAACLVAPASRRCRSPDAVPVLAFLAQAISGSQRQPAGCSPRRSGLGAARRAAGATSAACAAAAASLALPTTVPSSSRS
jgi:hypothetical protein